MLSFQAKGSEGGCILWLALAAAATPSLRSTTEVVSSATEALLESYSPSVAVNEAQSYLWGVLSFSPRRFNVRQGLPTLYFSTAGEKQASQCGHTLPNDTCL